MTMRQQTYNRRLVLLTLATEIEVSLERCLEELGELDADETEIFGHIRLGMNGVLGVLERVFRKARH